MLAIGFSFPGGRYHATPWGRHVNEGEVEWPPSPWRVLRALAAVWFRKGDRESYPEEELKRLLETLAEDLPVFQLPLRVSRGHSRHYMPLGGPKLSLVFDGFVRLDPHDLVVMVWPRVELDERLTSLLDHLLKELGYLGRSESWVEARRLTEWNGVPNAYPEELEAQFGHPGEEVERIRVLAPLTAAEFQAWRQGVEDAFALNQWRGRRRVRVSVPDSLYEAMLVDTGDLEKERWNQPPGSRWVDYLRPYGCLDGRFEVRRDRGADRAVRAVRFVLAGRPLPRTVEAVRVGELFRRSVLKQCGSEAPPVITGRTEDKRVLQDGHRHAFFVPEDVDGDGNIDHLLLYCPESLPLEVLRSVAQVTKLWTEDGRREWPLYLEGMADLQGGTGEELSPLFRRSRWWVSVTPYLHPWYRKRNGKFGPEDQIRRELALRGLPEPEVIRWIPAVWQKGRPVYSLEFVRFRRGGSRTLRQPDRRGGFYVLRFSEEVSGPILLGFGCHFGLGQFMPATEEQVRELLAHVGEAVPVADGADR